MHILGKYKETDRMSDLICDNYPMLLVLSRFNIALGFGDKNIGEVCSENGVDKKTFLSVVNLLLDEDIIIDGKDLLLSAEPLLTYLHNSHVYFLDFRLPAIREKLAEAVNYGKNDLSEAIIRYYDEYVAEVKKHMMYEEEVLFPYVLSLLEGKKIPKYSITVFSRQHDNIEERLTEFKQIIIKYYPVRSTNEINSVLFDIFNCEKDLASHNIIENRFFIPVIEALENNMDSDK